MADTALRTPFLVGALLCAGAVLVIDGSGAQIAGLIAPFTGRFAPGLESPPGRGVPALALIDTLVLLAVGLLAAPLVIPPRIHAKYQAVVTVIVGLLTALAGLKVALAAFAAALMMIAVLLAFPFGTIVYMIKWASFDRGGASAILAVGWTLKIAIAVLLILAHQRFVRQIGLILLLGTSLALGFIVGFLLALPPGFLAAITDCIAAIVAAIGAIIWGLVLAIGALPGAIKALRVDR